MRGGEIGKRKKIAYLNGECKENHCSMCNRDHLLSSKGVLEHQALHMP